MVRRHTLRVALAAGGLAVLVTVGCTTSPPKDKASFSGDVEAPTFSGPESTESTTPTTALSPASVVLAPDGLGSLAFSTQSARAMNGLTQAFGRAEHITVVPEGANCGATRIFRWKNFDVLINEVSARSGGAPGLAGWALGAAAPSLGLKTDKGIGIGSTVAAVRAAYGPAVTIAGATLEIRAANGVITGELDGPNNAARVKTLRAGAACAG
jgi:hypothetical protein